MCIKKPQQNKIQNKTLKYFIRDSGSNLSYINSDEKNSGTAGDNSPAVFLRQLNLLYRFSGIVIGFDWVIYHLGVIRLVPYPSSCS